MEKFDDQLYGDQQFCSRPKAIYQAYAQAVKEIFNPKSIIDLGCANAYALDWWQKQGIKISGIEPARAAFKYMPKTVRPFVKQLDLRQPLNLNHAEVVNFTEVAEHINKKYESIMLNNVINCVKDFLIISWSSEFYPDKPNDHINPRSLFYVKNRLKRLGLFFEPELTQTLKSKLNQPIFSNWRHWGKNIIVFSKIKPTETVLILHHEFHPSYWNKNIGYFMQTCLDHKLKVKFLTQTTWLTWLKKYHRVWLYPYEKHLLLKLLILKLQGNKTIIKLDSIVVRAWRAQLISWLVFKVLAESKVVAKPFGQAKNLQFFSGGLSQKNINLIRKLKIKRQKQILFSGRQTYQKGIDRFKKINIPGWKLKIASNLSGKEYYQEILKSSLVVLPTRGEGWPNVFQDAWFCKRLFLTTNKAQCREGIINQDFYVANLKKGLAKIINNLDWYYRHYDELYDQTKFVQTDKVFLSLITNQG